MRIAQAFTACDAYAAIKASGQTEKQRSRVLAFITANSGMDWSIGELAHAMGMEKSTVSRCLNEMLNDFHPPIVAKPERKDRVSGVRVRPVGLLVMGQQALFA